ncbi:target of rapamycin complex subunit wat1-like [Durio zibethinus]|uniref:Target of rapamycin complex subunit LST8 n=1 Tax=Durio zibethinus TaxID=66656 RepID=A0A6P5YRE4_DURZI|nr:target of rapamycin complex subunit wat1-like [Durio zibethinus]
MRCLLHQHELCALTVTWDGSLVVAANNHGTCYVWRLLRGSQIFGHCIFSLHCQDMEFNRYPLKSQLLSQGHQRWVMDCLFSVDDDAYLITASSDTTAKLWSMSTGEEIKTYQGHHKATVCCSLHDGALLHVKVRFNFLLYFKNNVQFHCYPFIQVCTVSLAFAMPTFKTSCFMLYYNR